MCICDWVQAGSDAVVVELLLFHWRSAIDVATVVLKQRPKSPFFPGFKSILQRASTVQARMGPSMVGDSQNEI